MTNKVIAPMTPPNCDLRDFPFMPLDVVRLRDSDITAISNGDEFRCAVLLWCASWHQVPAASIPDDDIVLSQFAGFGRVVKEWKKVREGALRGWIKCSDGRLYHPVVAEKACEAWNSRIAYRERKEAERKRKAEERAKKKSLDDIQTDQPCPPDISTLSAGQDKGQIDDFHGLPPENALIGTVDSGEGQWTVDRDSKSSSPPPRLSDDFSPQSPADWLDFFSDEHGIHIDHHSIHDRKKFWPLATAWARSGVTVGQMRMAVHKAQSEAKEPIAYLPAYADRVLATQTTSIKTSDQSRHHGISKTNFEEGVHSDGRF